MSRPVNEAGVVRSITKAIQRSHPGAWFLKVHGGPEQSRGVPDLLVSVTGLLIALEVKHQKPGESREHALGRASVSQEVELEKIRRSGATAAVVLGAEEALEVIDQALSARRG